MRFSSNFPGTRVLVATVLVLGAMGSGPVARTWPDGPEKATPDAKLSPIAYQTPRKLCELANPLIHESSGLAACRVQSGILWTHNDSGDEARIFAFNLSGEDLGAYSVPGAEAMDWEDMASFRLRGRDCLLVADTGNNWAERSQGTLYLVEEPEIGHGARARLLQTVHFQYEDRPHNCEAVGFDPIRREVLLATKEFTFSAGIYRLAWPDRQSSDIVKASRIGTVPHAMVTAMDISPDGRRAVVLTYGDAYQYVRKPSQDWRDALTGAGRRIPMPPRRQGESICYGRNGRTLYLTSEKRPTPLYELRPVNDK